MKGILKTSIDRAQEVKLLEQERDQIELENAFLRSHINPHLLFNSLQFIKHQVHKGSAKAEQAIALLAELMHYSLKATSQGNTVPLTEELEYIKQYVELAQLRSDNIQHFKWQTKLTAATPNLELLSGILGNFIETVFKHGNLTQKSDPGVGSLEVKGNKLSLQLRNLKRPENIYRRTGIGMNNIRKRLELLYPEKYKLKILDENNHYHVSLEMEL